MFTVILLVFIYLAGVAFAYVFAFLAKVPLKIIWFSWLLVIPVIAMFIWYTIFPPKS